MARFKATAPKARTMVWRISKRAPGGEWVDPANVEEPTMPKLPEVSSGGWVMSSFDLLKGTDITEDDHTIPGDLYDELFAPPATAPKKPEK